MDAGLRIPDCHQVCEAIGAAMAQQDLREALHQLERYVELRQMQQEHWARLQALSVAEDCLFEEPP